ESSQPISSGRVSSTYRASSRSSSGDRLMWFSSTGPAPVRLQVERFPYLFSADSCRFEPALQILPGVVCQLVERVARQPHLRGDLGLGHPPKLGHQGLPLPVGQTAFKYPVHLGEDPLPRVPPPPL